MFAEVFKDLLKVDLPDLAFSGVQADSRVLGAGDVFFAFDGAVHHGNDYAANAIDAGAVAIVSDKPLTSNMGVPVFVVEDARKIYAEAAAILSGAHPQYCVAVTGTNGKTSVVSFVRQIWAALGYKAASIGTLGVSIGDTLISGEMTTPDALTMHQNLAALKRQGIERVAMEASSHGIEQRRLDGIEFTAVGFTNLTRDHLDYHKTVENYRAAKLRLFTDLLPKQGVAVINADTPDSDHFVHAVLDTGATLFTTGENGAHIELLSVERQGLGQLVKVKVVGEDATFTLPLVGHFQVENVLIAAGLVMATGEKWDDIVGAIEGLKGAPGRLELVVQEPGRAAFVDYAHTPDALETALKALRPFVAGKLYVVFGCGGDRDAGKRPLMGAIAVEHADVAIVTDDNPRTEDAALIRQDVMAGAIGALEIGDRKEAIYKAVGLLSDGDILLVAGKGHEDYQIIGTTKHHFSDHEMLKSAFNQK